MHFSKSQSPWWQDSVIYQIYPPTFADGNGDGIGDLRGIIERLDYLNDGNPNSQTTLGVDAIWLSPIYRSPMRDNGYDVSDYCDIHPNYGTMADFDELLQEAHNRSIRIILDLVLNHTSIEHKWFQESCSSRDNAKADWYLWRDPAEDGGVPNNWKSYMGGTGWTFHEQRQQYYFHVFGAFQPDLNWHHPEVRLAIADILRFWLDKGVDGFRLDASSVYSKDKAFRDNPRKFTSADEADYDSYHHLYDKDLPDNHQIIQEFRAILDSYDQKLLIGETFMESKLNESIMFYGVNNDELHLPFSFELPFSPWHPGYLQQQIEAKESLLPAGAWPVHFLDNHDLPRHLSRWISCSLCTDSKTVAMGAAALLLTLRGTSVLYYGQEIGMENHETIPKSKMRDRLMLENSQGDDRQSRDGARTPMQWSNGSHAGFSFEQEANEPWLPVHPNYKQVNVKVQNGDKNSVLSFYRQLIKARRNSLALRFGNWKSLIHYPHKYLAYTRTVETEQALVIINFVHQCPLELDQDLDRKGWQLLVSNKRQSNPENLDIIEEFEVSIFSRQLEVC